MTGNPVKGYAAGIISAVTFGMNPFFGIQLYQEGLKPLSVLFYRFLFASAMLGIYMLVTRKRFSFELKQLPHVIAGGVLLAATCLAWFFSFQLMDSGIGATIMFVYPVMVASIMVIGFHEKLTREVLLSVILALAGVAVLCRPGEGAVVTAAGVVLVLLSGLIYSIYIVMIKVSGLGRIAPETLTFYTMGIGAVIFLGILGSGANLQMLPSVKALGNALGLAFFPSLLSFLLIAVSVRHIGATVSAVLGALEPVTAVVIGCFFFGEKFTWSLLAGIILILSSVVIIICGRKQDGQQQTFQEVK